MNSSVETVTRLDSAPGPSWSCERTLDVSSGLVTACALAVARVDGVVSARSLWAGFALEFTRDGAAWAAGWPATVENGA